MPKKAPTFNPLDTSEYPNRVFKNMFVSVVGGFIFEVMHRMEGKWSGLSAVPVGVSLVDGDEMEEEEDASPRATCASTATATGWRGAAMWTRRVW